MSRRVLAEFELPDFPIRDGISINTVVELADIAADTAPQTAVTQAEQDAENQRCVTLTLQPFYRFAHQMPASQYRREPNAMQLYDPHSADKLRVKTA